MSEIIILVLTMALRLLPMFIKNIEDRERYEKQLKNAIEKQKRSVGDLTDIREGQKEVDDKLREEWRKKWGK